MFEMPKDMFKLMSTKNVSIHVNVCTVVTCMGPGDRCPSSQVVSECVLTSSLLGTFSTSIHGFG